MINSHIDRYSKHELLEDCTTPNTPPATPQQQQQQEQNLSSKIIFYPDQSYYQ